MLKFWLFRTHQKDGGERRRPWPRQGGAASGQDRAETHLSAQAARRKDSQSDFGNRWQMRENLKINFNNPIKISKNLIFQLKFECLA